MRGLGILKFYKMYDDVILPTRATSESACFDISAYLIPGKELKSHDNYIWTTNIVDENERSVLFGSGTRMLIPTGLIVDIPAGHSVRLHPRSGLSFKSGLTLANQEGIIDSDYKEEIFVSMTNISPRPKKIIHNQRIAQGELVVHQSYLIRETDERPVRTTERKGGFGSTGE